MPRTRVISEFKILCRTRQPSIQAMWNIPVAPFTNMALIQYSPRNMHTVFALLCFVVVIHWLIFPYPSGLLHWHCGNLTIAPVPAKQPWWIWINTSCEFIMNDCITTTKQSTTKPGAYFLGYTVPAWIGYHMPSKVWDELTYSFLNFNGCTVGVYEWINNFFQHFTMDVITNPCWH